MFKVKKLLILFMLISCFFILISSASAADYHVKNNTKHKDISNWMKNNARSGNNLIFDVSTYNLTDTLTINKPINVKSNKKTQINFTKNKHMFKITTSGVSFSGLTLNHNGKGTKKTTIGVIYASGTSKKINVKKVNINAMNSYVTGILITKWKGSVSNSNIKIKGHSACGIDSSDWTGNLLYSKIYAYGDDDLGIYSLKWNGKIYNSKVYNYGKWSYSAPSAVVLVNSVGSISKSTLVSTNAYAAMLSKVKVTSSSLSSKSGFPKIYRYKPDLVTFSQIGISGSTYYFKVYNIGLGSSNTCYLGLKVGSTFKKIQVKALTSGKYVTVKIKVPYKYINKKYTKTVKVDYYNKVTESNETNNVFKFN